MGKLRSRGGFTILAGTRYTVKVGKGELNEGVHQKLGAGLCVHDPSMQEAELEGGVQV